jgi:uncharacterized protein (TIGR02246 family)
MMTNTEAELVELEKRFWQAIKDKDAATAMRYTDDPCIVAGPQGVANIGREALGKMLANPSYTLHDFRLSEVQVRFVADDVAVVAYKVSEELSVDGQRLSFDASDASTWVRRDGAWLCALHSEAIAGDPYGRDRRATTIG